MLPEATLALQISDLGILDLIVDDMEADERPRKIQKLGDERLDLKLESGPTSMRSDGLPGDGSSSGSPDSKGAHQAEEYDEDSHDRARSQGDTIVIEDHEPFLDPPMSKNQLKKLKRKQEWEAGRAYRKAKRKEKLVKKREQKRAAKEAEHEVQVTSDLPSDGKEQQQNGTTEPKKPHHLRATQLPITFVLDCGFDDLMLDKERISLAAQLTRCYSDNHRAPFRAHMVVSSFNGKLRDRFEGLFANHHHSWRGVSFLDEDFVEAAELAKGRMQGKEGGKLSGVLDKADGSRGRTGNDETPDGEVIYLSSDSPDTLTELKPYSTYIIGGLVDRNRHKGICYKRAMDRGIKTAKLPIGDYMQMTSRFVLATNHVSEIMLRWLELGDWGEAFLRVVPKRKGGVLKAKSTGEDHVDETTALRDEDGTEVGSETVGLDYV